MQTTFRTSFLVVASLTHTPNFEVTFFGYHSLEHHSLMLLYWFAFGSPVPLQGGRRAAPCRTRFGMGLLVTLENKHIISLVQAFQQATWMLLFELVTSVKWQKWRRFSPPINRSGRTGYGEDSREKTYLACGPRPGKCRRGLHGPRPTLTYSNEIRISESMLCPRM